MKQLFQELLGLHQSIAELENIKEKIKQTGVNQEKFTKAFQQNSIPMTISTMKDGRFVNVSDAFLRLVERKRDEVIGYTSRETGFITEEQRSFFHNELSKNGRIENLEMEVQPKGTGVRHGLFNVVMISFNNENYLLTTIQDITDRKHAELHLKETELKFRTIADFTYDWENWVGGDGKPLWISPSVERISGYSISECMNMTDYPFPMIYPEDHGNILAAMQQANERPLNDIEFRIIKKDRTLRWGAVSTNPVFTESGSRMGHRSGIRDITERKRMEEKLREQTQYLRTILDTTKDGFGVFTEEGMITEVNESICRMLGYERSELLGKQITEIVAQESPDITTARLHHVFAGSPEIFEGYHRCKDGSIINVEISLNYLKRGGTGQFFCFCRDITTRRQIEKMLLESKERFRELSIMDSLTRLYNSRHFYAQLKTEMERSKRYEQPLTLLMLDLDDFKVFNDTYGHIEGDEVLSRLGRVIKRCLRETDIAFRYGGEEFTILLPMTTSAEGTVIAERIRQEFKKESFSPKPGCKVHLTVSIGIGQYEPGEDLKAFVHRVDMLMYQGKKNGKDQVCPAA